MDLLENLGRFSCIGCQLLFTQTRFPELICSNSHIMCLECVTNIEKSKEIKNDSIIACVYCKAEDTNRKFISYELLLKIKNGY
jgi:hypothetical protein